MAEDRRSEQGRRSEIHPQITSAHAHMDDLDQLVSAFASFHNKRIRELCGEVNRENLFETYALAYARDENDDPSAAAQYNLGGADASAKRQKLAESERVLTQIEAIFARRKAPMMRARDRGGDEGPSSSSRPHSARPERPPTPPPPPTPPTVSLDELRAAVEAFASRLGIDGYAPRF